jgi:trans-2,3-dihydro-3-hydroxyanthranilate isomerase
MQKKLKIFQIDAFTNKPFKGNAAAVTFSNDLKKDEMQSIAKEMNLSETAFLSISDMADYNLRWFTPKNEVNLCGHATIASLHYLKEQGFIKGNQSITFQTLSGVLKCGSENGKYFMQIPAYRMDEFNGDKKRITDALGLKKESLDENIPFIKLEKGNLYIHIKKLNDLKDLAPNFKELYKISEEGIAEGFVVFTTETIDKNNDAHSRYFVPFHGIDEDPVTGSTNGPLLLVLKKLELIRKFEGDISLTFEQGDFLGREGRINVSFNSISNELYISGNAVTVLKGEIIF